MESFVGIAGMGEADAMPHRFRIDGRHRARVGHVVDGDMGIGFMGKIVRRSGKHLRLRLQSDVYL